MSKMRSRPAAVALALGVGSAVTATAVAAAMAPAAASSKAPNKGDVWVDNVGEPAGPGHEMDPHLACADINLWGNGLADASGKYTIDGWPPSGSHEQVYASTWKYDRNAGGSQVTSVIKVKRLIAAAVKAGDAPVNKQGYHFKLQFVQQPQKHKTFWVNCKAPQPTPTPTPTVTPTVTPTPSVTPTPTATESTPAGY